MLLLTHPMFMEHDTGPGHPERPARLTAILERLRRWESSADARRGQGEPSALEVTWREPRPAPHEALLRVHTKPHVDHVLAQRGRHGEAGDEVPLSPASVDAAILAAGAAIDAIEHVFADRRDADAEPHPHRRAFALVRPPGHHAESDRAMGFCVFNNVAIAAAHAIATDRARRVLVVDWDVHHGNGTQEIFEERDDVLFFSVHQWPLYPGTGAATERGRGVGAGFTINVPLAAGGGDDTYRRAFEEVLVPAADRFRPDLVLVSAGFDAHERDPLGGMRVTATGFATLAQIVAGIADTHADGRLAAVLEGGYSLDGLAESVEACVRVWGETEP